MKGNERNRYYGFLKNPIEKSLENEFLNWIPRSIENSESPFVLWCARISHEKQVFDANEMLPWIRTFIGRIVEFHCSSPFVEKRFYHDLQTMYQMYEEDS